MERRKSSKYRQPDRSIFISENRKIVKKPKYLYDYIAGTLLIIIALFLMFRCSSTKMIQTSDGWVYRYQAKEIKKVKKHDQQFNGF